MLVYAYPIEENIPMPSSTKTYEQDEYAEQGTDVLATFILCVIAIAYVIAKMHS